MNELILNVSVEEGNKIINALAALPYSVSFELIHKIQSQATEQTQKSDEKT